MPKPNKGEQKEDFLQRCMSSEEANKDYPDQKQRYAVCLSFWENKSKGSYKDLDKLDIEE